MYVWETLCIPCFLWIGRRGASGVICNADATLYCVHTRPITTTEYYFRYLVEFRICFLNSLYGPYSLVKNYQVPISLFFSPIY
jgi:hypothetical protein